ncbi:MAG: urease accessory protein UreF [Reyranellaceae bacterium]
MGDPLALLRLLQLASPALPIGAFNFSQGLEYAIDQGWIRDEQETGDWIMGVARHGMATLDLPILMRLHAAWGVGNTERVRQLSAELVASRETQELRAEERHLGQALAKVLAGVGLAAARDWRHDPDASHAALFALAAVDAGASAHDTATAFLWAWAENQVIAAVKLLPLGQSAGQRVLESLRTRIPALVEEADVVPDEDIGAATPAVAMASAWHETQYTRLFRS